jgi:hypothetical protein
MHIRARALLLAVWLLANATLSSNSGTNWLSPAALLGDANLDGHVDVTDLSIVLNDFGKTTPNWTDGNFDGHSTIDLTDLSEVLNNFGLSSSSGSQSSLAVGQFASIPVPEPATLFLFSAAAFTLRYRRNLKKAIRGTRDDHNYLQTEYLIA